MPWKVSGVVEKRRQFIEQGLSENWTMTELCAQHGISRQAGYNTLTRYQRAGWKGLEAGSRAPLGHPNPMSGETEQQIVELRQAHRRWGPRKLKVVLEREQPEEIWPAASTIGELLRREGLVMARKQRRRIDRYTTPFASASAPKRVWCGDFKGWRRTQNGERIDPLTVSDACTRYRLRCQVVEKMDTARVQAIFEAAFRECGLPEAIRTDNGAPFASRAIAGLSRLALWWMKLGIVPERIQPAHPEQNWTARTHASDPAARNHESDGRQPARATAPLRSVPPRVPSTTSAPGARHAHSGKLLHRVTASLSGARVRTGIRQLGDRAAGVRRRAVLLETS
jgi:transposase